jgi:hypothetical protein
MVSDRTPDAATEAVDRMAEVAPELQGSFDMDESSFVEVDIADREENQVGFWCTYMTINMACFAWL